MNTSEMTKDEGSMFLRSADSYLP